MIPSANSDRFCSAWPREQVQVAEDRRAGAAVEEVAARSSCRRPASGSHEPSAVEREDGRREREPPAQLRDLPNALQERGEHASASSAASSRARRCRVTVPPAASIFCRADAETACTVTVSACASSPRPSTFTGSRVFFSRPTATSVAGVTSAPASNRAARSSTVHDLVRRPERADAAWTSSCAGRAACRRACRAASGRPRSRRACSASPTRDFWPFCPRPDVLPWPDADAAADALALLGGARRRRSGCAVRSRASSSPTSSTFTR